MINWTTWGSWATGVPTVTGRDAVTSATSPAAPAVNCARRRHDGNASSSTGPNSTGHVFVAIPRPSRMPAVAARRPEIFGPARNTMANAARENSRQAGSLWPCTLLTRMGSGLHAYWNLRSAARPPEAPATVPTSTVTPRSARIDGIRAMISQVTCRCRWTQYAPARANAYTGREPQPFCRVFRIGSR